MSANYEYSTNCLIWKHPPLECNFKSVTYRNAFCGGFKNFKCSWILMISVRNSRLWSQVYLTRIWRCLCIINVTKFSKEIWKWKHHEDDTIRTVFLEARVPVCGWHELPEAPRFAQGMYRNKVLIWCGW